MRANSDSVQARISKTKAGGFFFALKREAVPRAVSSL
jgi:hypothetical protein